MGTLQPRKNLITLIESFSLFKKQNPEFKLVICGKKGWLYEHIFQRVKELKLDKEVKFVGFIKDEDLANLYTNAFCFVLPSLYEGFGLPLLEAMSFDCPVISSFTSSLPEVGGDACLYFDPRNSSELAEKLPALGTNVKTKHGLGKIIGRHVLKGSVDVEIDQGKEGERRIIVEVPIK